MAPLSTITAYLDLLLEPHLYHCDGAYNGVQVDTCKSEVKRVAYAVDAGLSILEKAVKAQADLLITHHGLFWGASNQIISGIHGQKISTLIKGGCSLYSSHLPLDGNLEVGNAAELCRFIGLEEVGPFARHHGVTIGARGRTEKATSIELILDKLSHLPGFSRPLVLPFGKSNISTVGIATGAGGFGLYECKELGLDLFISGEPKQHNYHEAKEFNQNAIFAGHYATETPGVTALAKKLEAKFGVSTIFIDEPTGI